MWGRVTASRKWWEARRDPFVVCLNRLCRACPRQNRWNRMENLHEEDRNFVKKPVRKIKARIVAIDDIAHFCSTQRHISIPNSKPGQDHLWRGAFTCAVWKAVGSIDAVLWRFGSSAARGHMSRELKVDTFRQLPHHHNPQPQVPVPRCPVHGLHLRLTGARRDVPKLSVLGEVARASNQKR